MKTLMEMYKNKLTEERVNGNNVEIPAKMVEVFVVVVILSILAAIVLPMVCS